MSVVELRQYTIKPRQRDVLIALFEHEFVATQEEAAKMLIGIFCNADNADRFASFAFTVRLAAKHGN